MRLASAFVMGVDPLDWEEPELFLEDISVKRNREIGSGFKY